MSNISHEPIRIGHFYRVPASDGLWHADIVTRDAGNFVCTVVGGHCTEASRQWVEQTSQRIVAAVNSVIGFVDPPGQRRRYDELLYLFSVLRSLEFKAAPDEIVKWSAAMRRIDNIFYDTDVRHGLGGPVVVSTNPSDRAVTVVIKSSGSRYPGLLTVSGWSNMSPICEVLILPRSEGGSSVSGPFQVTDDRIEVIDDPDAWRTPLPTPGTTESPDA